MSGILEKIREYANREPNRIYIARAVGIFIIFESTAFYTYVLRPYFLNNDYNTLVYITTAVVHFIVLFPLFSKLFGWSQLSK